MTVELAVKQDTGWIDEFAEKNRPLCPSCGRLMKRTGTRLSKNGEFRTFKYGCSRCRKYARITTQESGSLHEPSEVGWRFMLTDKHRPWCCGEPMRKASSYLNETTGVHTFSYRCRKCRGKKTIKTYEPRDLPANPTLEALDPTRIDELIRSKIGDNEDGIQDAWLAVLERGVTTEDGVLKVAEEVFKSRRSRSIRSEYTDVSLSRFAETDKDNPVALDRIGLLGTGDTIPLEDAETSEPAYCPHCRASASFARVGFKSDGKGRRQRFLCRVCWRTTLWPRRQQSRKLGKIHIAEVSKGDEVDLASVSRAAVAKAAHCSAPYVSAILCGHATASLPLFYDIAKALNTSMDELFKAITGANGQNPAMIKAKYIVNGKGYYNLREAALSLGVELRRPTHYKELPPELQAQITRNRPFRGK